MPAAGKYQPANLGQSMSEYMMLSLVALFSIGALMLLGGNLSQIFTGMMPGRPPEAAAVTGSISHVPAPAQTGSGGNAVAPSLPPLTGAETLRFTLGNGETITLSGYPADMKTALLTSGANGTTSRLLSMLDTVIQQIESQNTLTPDQQSILTKLSTQGHHIAELEKRLEDALVQGGTANPADLKVSYLGQQMGLMDLSGNLGYNSGTGDQSEIKAFRDLFEQAKASGALSDPTSQAIVSTLVDQIGNIANGIENATWQVVDNGAPYSEATYRQEIIRSLTERDITLNIDTQKTLLDLGPATVTHDDSNAICAAGGTNCQQQL